MPFHCHSPLLSRAERPSAAPRPKSRSLTAWKKGRRLLKRASRALFGGRKAKDSRRSQQWEPTVDVAALQQMEPTERARELMGMSTDHRRAALQGMKPLPPPPQPTPQPRRRTPKLMAARVMSAGRWHAEAMAHSNSADANPANPLTTHQPVAAPRPSALPDQHGRALRINAKIAHRHAAVLVDSGSFTGFFRREFVDSLPKEAILQRGKPRPWAMDAVALDHASMKVTCQVTVKIEYDNKSYTITGHVTDSNLPDGIDILLGADTLQELGAVIETAKRTVTLNTAGLIYHAQQSAPSAGIRRAGNRTAVFCPAKVGTTTTTAFADTGSDVTLMTAQLVQSAGPESIRTVSSDPQDMPSIAGAAGGDIEPQRLVDADITLGNKAITVRAYVANDLAGMDIILGMDTLTAFDTKIDMTSMTMWMRNADATVKLFTSATPTAAAVAGQGNVTIAVKDAANGQQLALRYRCGDKFQRVVRDLRRHTGHDGTLVRDGVAVGATEAITPADASRVLCYVRRAAHTHQPIPSQLTATLQRSQRQQPKEGVVLDLQQPKATAGERRPRLPRAGATRPKRGQELYVVAAEDAVIVHGSDVGTKDVYHRVINAKVIGTNGIPVNFRVQGTLHPVRRQPVLPRYIASRFQDKLYTDPQQRQDQETITQWQAERRRAWTAGNAELRQRHPRRSDMEAWLTEQAEKALKMRTYKDQGGYMVLPRVSTLLPRQAFNVITDALPDGDIYGNILKPKPTTPRPRSHGQPPPEGAHHTFAAIRVDLANLTDTSQRVKVGDIVAVLRVGDPVAMDRQSSNADEEQPPPKQEEKPANADHALTAQDHQRISNWKRSKKVEWWCNSGGLRVRFPTEEELTKWMEQQTTKAVQRHNKCRTATKAAAVTARTAASIAMDRATAATRAVAALLAGSTADGPRASAVRAPPPLARSSRKTKGERLEWRHVAAHIRRELSSPSYGSTGAEGGRRGWRYVAARVHRATTEPASPGQPTDQGDAKVTPPPKDDKIETAVSDFHKLVTTLGIFDPRTADGDFEQQMQIARLVWEFADVFEDDPKVVLANSSVQHHIDTGDARPIRCHPYNRSPHERAIIKQHVEKMLKDNAIRKCSSPWAAQVVLTPKPDGSWRFCTDYSKLGKVTKRDCYPLPRIETILNSTRGARWFSAHDLKSGYWQTATASNDGTDLKTAFITEEGQFCWNVMPFGLRNSGATQQRLIDEVLDGLLWKSVAAYVDDVLVYSPGSFGDHLKDLRRFYDRMRRAGLHIKPTKCAIARHSCDMLGHHIDGKVRRPKESNVQALVGFPRPRTAKQLRSFIGLASFFRDYINQDGVSFAQMAAPLYKLSRGGKRVHRLWTDDHEAAFLAIKKALMSQPVLRLPEYGPGAGKFILQTDASEVGLGAVLLQTDTTTGKQHPVVYLSRNLKDPERKYDVKRLEGLAVVWAINKLQHYLRGSKFECQTDHANLRWILEAQHFRHPQVARWKAVLSEYNFEIKYVGANRVAVADALSRDPRHAKVVYKVTRDDMIAAAVTQPGEHKTYVTVSNDVPAAPDQELSEEEAQARAIEEKDLNRRLQGLRGARRRAQLAAISNSRCAHPSPLTLRDLRNGRRPRRSPEVAARYKAHKERARAAGQDPLLSLQRKLEGEWEADGTALLPNPFPYDIHGEHHVLWFRPQGNGRPDWNAKAMHQRARAALRRHGIGAEAVLQINDAAHRSVPSIAHMHVFTPTKRPVADQAPNAEDAAQAAAEPRLTAVDLFAGGGATSAGVKEAGYDVLAAIDNDRCARLTYRKIHPGTPIHDCDLSEVTAAAAILKKLGHIDLITITPPCAPFSSASRKWNRKYPTTDDDPRAQLTLHALRATIPLQPGAFLIENTPRFASSKIWKTAKKWLQDAGYNVEHTTVNAANTGVPQKRRRFIATAVRRPLATNIRMAERAARTEVTTARTVFPTEDVVWHYAGDGRTACVRSTDEPYPTVRTNSDRGPYFEQYKPRQGDAGPVSACRKLSMAEFAALQGWTPEMAAHLPPQKTRAIGIIGRSIPPPLATWVARLIRHATAAEVPIEIKAAVATSRHHAPPRPRRHTARSPPPPLTPPSLAKAMAIVSAGIQTRQRKGTDREALDRADARTTPSGHGEWQSLCACELDGNRADGPPPRRLACPVATRSTARPQQTETEATANAAPPPKQLDLNELLGEPDDAAETQPVGLKKWTAAHNDRCEVCDKGGDLLCCDFCNLVFHLHCLDPPLTEAPEGDWACPECVIEAKAGEGAHWKWRTSPPPLTDHHTKHVMPAAAWPDDFVSTTMPMSQRLAELQGADPELGPVMDYLQHKTLPANAVAKRKLLSRASNYVLTDGVLHFIERHPHDDETDRHLPAIPRKLVTPIVKETHALGIGGHMGEYKLVDALRQRYHWVGITTAVRRFLKRCSCQLAKTKLKKQQQITRPMKAEHPWFYVHVDLWKPGTVSSEGHKYVLTVIDRFTRYPEMIPIKNKEAATVARAFYENVICRHGTSAYVVSDNGTEFEDIFDELTRLYGIRRIRTSPHHPRANAQVERLHGFMRGALSSLIGDQITEWHRYLPSVAFAYRSTVVKQLGYSPFFLMHGRNPVLPGELIIGTEPKAAADVDKFTDDMAEALTKAFTAVQQQDKDVKERRMLSSPWTPDITYQVGDLVLHYRVPERDKEDQKLSHRWHHAVIDQAKHPSYIVRDATGRKLRANARYLVPDHTEQRSERSEFRPKEPAAAKVAAEVATDKIAPGVKLIIESRKQTEPWRLVMATDDQSGVAAGCARVHYFDRRNRAAAPNKQVWKPAYFNTRSNDRHDVVTYTPQAWHDPYIEIVPLSAVIQTDVLLTKAGTITAADLHKLSDNKRTNWVWTQAEALPQTLDVGTWVLRRLGKRGKFVGRVVDVTRDADDGDAPLEYRIKYRDGTIEETDGETAEAFMQAFDASGFRQTTGWTAPAAGVRQLRRMEDQLRRRRRERQQALRIQNARARRERAEVRWVEVSGGGTRASRKANPGVTLMTDKPPKTPSEPARTRALNHQAKAT